MNPTSLRLDEGTVARLDALVAAARKADGAQHSRATVMAALIDRAAIDGNVGVQATKRPPDAPRTHPGRPRKPVDVVVAPDGHLHEWKKGTGASGLVMWKCDCGEVSMKRPIG